MKNFLFLISFLLASTVSFSQCFISSINANISACQFGSVYTMSGDFTYENNPGTGTVSVIVDNGTSTFTQTFNPPFTNGVAFNFQIDNITADGSPSTITVTFSDDAGCNNFIPYTAPAECACDATIGTFSESIIGISTTNYVLCFGDVINLNSNNDFTPAQQLSDAANPANDPVYDPGIGWLVYSCPPSVGTDPSQNVEISLDPCLVTVISFDDFSDINDQAIINAFPGVFTDNIVYYVPLTFYSMVDGFYSYDPVNGLQCFEMGVPYAVQYLPEITSSETQDCAASTVASTISGGFPQIDGSLFTAVLGSLTPTTATFVNTSCTNGGTITIAGVNGGDSFSFQVEDNNGCPITISGTMVGSGTATMTYPKDNYCQNEPNPTPTLTGSTGGTYTSSPSLIIDPVTGEIDLAASIPGTFTITYTGPEASCPPVSTFNIIIHALPNVDAGLDQTICEGASITLSGAGADTYSWNNGVTNNVSFTPTSTQTYTLTGTSAEGCQSTDQVKVTLEAAPTPTFTATSNSGCAPLVVTLTNTSSNGAACLWDLGDGSTATGCGSITHTYTGVGCYDVLLSSASPNGCTGSSTSTSFICVAPDPVASFSPVPSVLSQLNPTTQMVNTSTNSDTYQWQFGDGGSSTTTNPSYTFSSAPGSYVIQLIAISNFGCRDTAYSTIVVEEELLFFVPNAFTPDGDEFNQTFNPVFKSGFDPFDFNMLIFNRWGEVIFETNDAEIGWDGTYHDKLVSEGTYTWKIEFKSSKNDARNVVVGHLTILK